MKWMVPFLLTAVILSGCALVAHRPQRTPSSTLETKSFDAQFSVFSGPNMPSEITLVKSLPNAPLRIELQQLNPRIKCVDNEGQQRETFLLQPNSKGIYDKVTCSMTHNGSEYPDQMSLKAKIYVLLDEFVIPEKEFETKKSLIEFQKIIADKRDWSPQFISFIKRNVPSEIVSVKADAVAPVLITETSQSPHYYLDIESYSGEFENKTLFKTRKISVLGLSKKDSKSLYPQYNELSLVCGRGLSDRSIKQVTNGQGELFQLTKAEDPFYCHINKSKDSKDEKKNAGTLQVQFKAISYSKIQELISKSLLNEESQIGTSTKSYHETEFNMVRANYEEVKKLLAQYSASVSEIKKKIDQEKFLAAKEKTINALFPATVKGSVSRVGSLISLTPVKKTIFNEDGEMKSVLYINIQNSITYKVETLEFVEKITRSLPFEERVNLYLATSNAFKDDIPGTQIVVCEDRLDDFYSALGNIQTASNSAAASITQIINELSAVSVLEIKNCKSTTKEKSNIAYSRGKGQKDYLIQWKKVGEELEAVNVGMNYNSDILGQPMTSQVLRDRNFSHPAFLPGFKIPFLPDQAKYWQSDKKLYVIDYSDDEFVTPNR